MNATELFLALFYSFDGKKDELIWPNENSFEVIVGAILTQNTTWKNTQKSLENLRLKNALCIDGILDLQIGELAMLIKSSGFYNTKAKRLYALTRAIKVEFDDFDGFRQNVSREWLMGIKGIGAETCDAILAYACGRAVMVVDAYVNRILSYLGYEFQSYDEVQEWLMGLDFSQIQDRIGESSEVEIFKIFHILVLEFSKKYFKGKKLDDKGKNILKFE